MRLNEVPMIASFTTMNTMQRMRVPPPASMTD
jgi:hypothetical protein